MSDYVSEVLGFTSATTLETGKLCISALEIHISHSNAYRPFHSALHHRLLTLGTVDDDFLLWLLHFRFPKVLLVRNDVRQKVDVTKKIGKN